MYKLSNMTGKFLCFIVFAFLHSMKANAYEGKLLLPSQALATTNQALPQLVINAHNVKSAIITSADFVELHSRLIGKAGPSHFNGSSLVFNAQLDVPDLKPHITKKIQNVWQITHVKNDSNIYDLLNIEWLNSLAFQETGISSNKIRAEAFVRRVYRNAQGVQIIEGGVSLIIPINLINKSHISGQLMISLKEY